VTLHINVAFWAAAGELYHKSPLKFRGIVSADFQGAFFVLLILFLKAQQIAFAVCCAFFIPNKKVNPKD